MITRIQSLYKRLEKKQQSQDTVEMKKCLEEIITLIYEQDVMEKEIECRINDYEQSAIEIEKRINEIEKRHFYS